MFVTLILVGEGNGISRGLGEDTRKLKIKSTLDLKYVFSMYIVHMHCNPLYNISQD